MEKNITVILPESELRLLLANARIHGSVTADLIMDALNHSDEVIDMSEVVSG